MKKILKMMRWTMNSKSIKNNSIINLDNINKNQYVFSLTTEAHRLGLINSKEISNIQTGIMIIVKELIIKFNEGKSSSVKVETAQNILESVSYCLDAYCVRFEPPECIEILKSSDIKKLYKKSIEIIESYMEDSKKLYNEIMKTKLNIQLEAYNSTINNGFEKFFESYDYIFDIYDTLSDIDYPLLFDDMRVQGIKYIKNYLETLKIETQFCNHYTNEMIEDLLLDYGEIYKTDYKELLINIFELLLNNCIGRKMLGKNIRGLEIDSHECRLLASELKVQEPIKVKETVRETIETMVLEEEYGELLSNYIRKYEEPFIAKLMDALQNNSLDKLIIPHEEKIGKEDYIFTEGINMEDEDFKQIHSEILEAESIAKKIQIISSNIKSTKDFVDILKSDCLFDDEFEILFSTLSSEELVVLVTIVFCEELRNGEIELSGEALKMKSVNFEWETHFINHLLEQNPEKIRNMEKIINKILN
jgi:hypothetical protein